jgi:DNA-binding MarR family transcriptional regulator
MSVSDLAGSASLAQATLSRWLTKLVELGLVADSADETDGRRRFVELTDLAADRLDAYFRIAPIAGELMN